jgi:hypothetical protein
MTTALVGRGRCLRSELTVKTHLTIAPRNEREGRTDQYLDVDAGTSSS